MFAEQTALDFRTEAEKKAYYLNLMARDHAKFMEEARRIARHGCHDPTTGLNRYRIPHTVAIDHVREQMYIEPDPLNKTNKLLGSVFRADYFIKIGMVATKSEGCHARLVMLWTLEKYAARVKQAYYEEYIL